MIRVLIADDQALVRGAFRVLVNSDPELTVVGEASDGSEAITLAQSLVPDIALLDVRMPKTDGLDAARTILADPSLGSTRVVMLTTFDLDEYIFGALRIGASGFLLKDTPPADLLAGLKVVAAGEALLGPSVTRRVVAEFARNPGRADPTLLSLLTDREREVLALIGRGLSNGELAERLYISVATAKTHVSRLLAKLNARDRAQLVVAAYEAGLVVPGSS